MLADARLQSIICTTNLDAAEAFYRDILGLGIKDKSAGAIVFDVGGADLRVSRVPSLQPSEHTLLGFAVPDVAAVVQSLRKHGITLERFEHFPHDANGILTTPDGDRVAWFRDPDGNLLSVVQFGAAISLPRPT